MSYADLEGGGGGPDPPWNLQSLISPILLEMKKIVMFHICSLLQLYVKPINPQNNNQISSIQVCVMGFFLLKVGPPLEKFSGSAPVCTSLLVVHKESSGTYNK